MQDFITQEEYDEIEKMVMRAVKASNKSEASPYIKSLSFKENQFCGYTRCVFSELVSSVQTASGRVADKEQKIGFVYQHLYKLKWSIKK